ncbi:hypothetical protein BpHYR1_022874 [Brachionus plicatilis]|uniref:Uncharacterized protein n=1 Tax=Brachionus plicatilis TaxID=10195 RepID=A0A3M7S8L6_BRAPC|nr:hypothetical protein BpHYR1_022874 [Brachionus plicatilis]
MLIVIGMKIVSFLRIKNCSYCLFIYLKNRITSSQLLFIQQNSNITIERNFKKSLQKQNKLNKFYDSKEDDEHLL